jgi:aryl-alcohol dehydrogenase-like predicted oxidoreductase
MQTRRLGKTELMVSVLGLGGHEYRWLHSGNIANGRHRTYNPERTRVVERARAAGVNYFDTTFVEEVDSLGHALRTTGGLDDAIINGMIIDVLRRAGDLDPQGRRRLVAEEIETRLALLGRDYFDVFMMCSLDNGYDRTLFEEMLELYEQHRAAGHFRFIGVSCHSLDVLREVLSSDPPIHVVQFAHNYAMANEGDPRRAAVLDLIASLDLGFVAIKPLCWTFYGIPFTTINAEWHDIQQLVTHSAAWQVAQPEPSTSVYGVETVPELGSILAGADYRCDESLLQPYLANQRRLDIMVRNGARHSAEIQRRIVGLLKERTGQDLGDDLASYAAPVSQDAAGSPAEG